MSVSFCEHISHALVMSQSTAAVAQVYRRRWPHLGLVLVMEQVQSSTALSLPSPGKQAGTVWAVGSTLDHVAPITETASLILCFPRSPNAASSRHVWWRRFDDSGFHMGVKIMFFILKYPLFNEADCAVIAGWVTHSGPWASSVLNLLAACLNRPLLSQMGNL